MLEQEAANVPTDVFFWTKREFEKELKKCLGCLLPHTKAYKTAIGAYVFFESDYTPFLYINRNMPNYKKMAALWHEIGHFWCYTLECSCFDGEINYLKREYHALQYELKVALEKHYYKVVESIVEMINYHIKSPESDTYEYEERAFDKACKKITKLKLWEKVNKFLAKNS